MDKKPEKKTIEDIKKQLLAKKKQILADLSRVSRQDNHEADDRTAKFPEYGNKADENAQEISDYSTTIVAEKVLEKILADIDKTLERIENGTYGICKYCGKAINEKRLLARPTANSCISCKQKLQENE